MARSHGRRSGASIVPLVLGVDRQRRCSTPSWCFRSAPGGERRGASAGAARAARTRARQDYLLAKATVTGKQQADSALQKFYKDVLPADQGAARKLTFTRLAQLARQANVQLEHGTNTVKHEKGSQLSQADDDATRSPGDYRDVRKFIYSLETAPEFIVLENVGLSTSAASSRRRARWR